MKMITIQQNSGWENRLVGELIGSLHTYELQVLAKDNPNSSRKGKSITFSAEIDNDSNTEDLDDKTLYLLFENFKNILKGFKCRGQNQTGQNQGNKSNSSQGMKFT